MIGTLALLMVDTALTGWRWKSPEMYVRSSAMPSQTTVASAHRLVPTSPMVTRVDSLSESRNPSSVASPQRLIRLSNVLRAVLSTAVAEAQML